MKMWLLLEPDEQKLGKWISFIKTYVEENYIVVWLYVYFMCTCVVVWNENICVQILNDLVLCVDA